MAERKPIDWERIEAEYRAGVLSLREIAAQHEGVNHVAIARRAKKEGWSRDLAARIHARADDLVTRKVVTPDVTAKRVSEREVIEANAERIAQVRNEHRHDITRARSLSMSLLAELEAQTVDVPALAELGELLRSEDDRGIDKLNDLYRAVISLPERTKTMKALSESLKNLVTMEREAYGIADVNREQPQQPKRELSEVERASRLASLLDAARARSAAGGAPQ